MNLNDPDYRKKGGNSAMLDAVQYLGSIDRGWTKPQMFRCSDGHKYIVKFLGNPLGRKVLSSELIAFRLGKLMGLPVAPCKVIHISKGLIELYPALKEMKVQRGPHLGVYYYDNAVETDNDEVISKCVNLDKAAGMIAFDHWIQNWDRHNRNTSNLLYVKNRIVLIDHANCFDGPKWNADSLRRNKELTSVYWGKMYRRFVPYIDGNDPFKESIAKIQSISESAIKNALTDIPSQWGLKQEELATLTEYLQYRKLHLSKIMSDLQEYFPKWQAAKK